jgi:stage V sporulation protein G
MNQELNKELDKAVATFQDLIKKFTAAKQELEDRASSMVEGCLTVTSCQIYLVSIPNYPKTKATARVELNNQLVLTELSVIEGNNGLFVSYPFSEKKHEEFFQLVYPSTRTLREEIEVAVLKKYREEIGA